MDVPLPDQRRHTESLGSRQRLGSVALLLIVVSAMCLAAVRSEAQTHGESQPYAVVLETNDAELGEQVARLVSARLLNSGEPISEVPPTSDEIEGQRAAAMANTLDEAKHAYEQLEPAVAVERLSTWFGQLEGLDAPPSEPVTLERALLLRALAYLALRATGEAEYGDGVASALRELRNVAPAFHPSPIEHPPPLHEAFKAMQIEVAGDDGCALRVNAPAGLELDVSMDGRAVGAVSDVPCGPHSVRIKAPGYRSRGYRITLTQGSAPIDYDAPVSEGDTLLRSLGVDRADSVARDRVKALLAATGTRALTLRIERREDGIDASLTGLEGTGSMRLSVAPTTSAAALTERLLTSTRRAAPVVAAAAEPQSRDADESGPNWWLWTAAGAGVVLVAAVTVAIVFSAPSEESGFRITWERP